MGVEYRKINLQEIGIADIYSICNDAIKNDPDIYNKNGKAKLKYLGLLKALKDLNIPVSQLPNSMDEQEIRKVIDNLDKVVSKVSQLRPFMKVQKIREGQLDYLLVEEEERGRNIADLRSAYSIAKINERNMLEQKRESYETVEKPREIREKMEKAKENSGKRKEGKEFRQWLVETAKNSEEISEDNAEKFAEKITQNTEKIQPQEPKQDEPEL